MEKKTKYKLCPFCETNAIPETEYCCHVCYSSSPAIRQKFNAQTNDTNTKTNPKTDEINAETSAEQKLQEIIAKRSLLEIWEKLGFIGFLHTANFDNFEKIYKSQLLKSRQQLLNDGISFEDNAEPAVLQRTPALVKSMVRFYYRPITPTNISAYWTRNQRHPVLIVFDKNLLFDKNVLFCDGCAGSGSTIMFETAQQALSIDWEKVFGVGPFDPFDSVTRNYRNAKF